MLRTKLAVLIALLTGATGLSQAEAQSSFPLPPAPAPYGVRVGQPTFTNASHPNWHMAGRNAKPQQAVKGYPRLAASMYPCPRPGIPAQVGTTVYTNQAFAPHEMLYAHEYRSMYGPFYYRVKGNWIWTPFGMESHDKWELLGTEVKVKYRSSFSLGSLFFPPR